MAKSADILSRLFGRAAGGAAMRGGSDDDLPIGGTRAHAMQRLQIGVTGVVLMFLLVGLASIIERRADEAAAESVPDAAPTVQPSQASGGDDPLVTAGVVPDLPAQPSPTPAPTQTVKAPSDLPNAPEE